MQYKSQEMRHVIVSGTIALQSIRSLCEELFHEDHGETICSQAVVIQNYDPRPDMESLIQRYET